MQFSDKMEEGSGKIESQSRIQAEGSDQCVAPLGLMLSPDWNSASAPAVLVKTMGCQPNAFLAQ